MASILNSYASNDGGLGATLTDLGNTLFGPGALQAELYRKKAQELGLNIDTRKGLGDLFANSPTAADTAEGRRLIMQSEDPRKVMQGNLGVIASTYGADDPRTSNAATGAGESYASTPAGYKLGQNVELQKADMATQRLLAGEKYKADTTPEKVVVNGQPAFMPRSQAVQGATPVLSGSDAEGVLKMNNFGNLPTLTPDQKKAAGSLAPQDHLYNWDNLDAAGNITRGRSMDGKVDLTTGQPIPATARVISAGNAGTALGGPLGPDNKQMGDLRGKIVSNQELAGLTNEIERRVKADPTIIGAPGQIQKLGQNALAVARDAAIAMGKGKTVDDSINNIRAEALDRYGSGITTALPELFKPSINELEALHYMMVYKTAEALAGQEGRNLSDRDVAAARSAAGDPTAWTASSPQVLAHLAMIRNIANANVTRYTNMLKTQSMTNVPVQPLPTQGNVPLTGPAAAPAAAPMGNPADPLGLR